MTSKYRIGNAFLFLWESYYGQCSCVPTPPDLTCEGHGGTRGILWLSSGNRECQYVVVEAETDESHYNPCNCCGENSMSTEERGVGSISWEVQGLEGGWEE